MQIPFLDLKKINASYHEDFKRQLEFFLESGNYILGNAVSTFEREFATYCNANHCIGTGNGLDALTLILKGYITLGKLNLGAEVLVAANTYIATIIAIQNAGLVPVLIDASAETYNLDYHLLPTKPSANVKALMVTHLYGQLANMEALKNYCDKHNLILLADAAQAHGAANEKGQKAGSLAEAAGFSFYPTKNLGALGDGGCVVTKNTELATVIKKLRNYGRNTTTTNKYIGINSRLDEIQAAFLSIKLKKLEEENDKRKRNASFYLKEITNPKINLPQVLYLKSHVFHQFVITVTNRQAFRDYLNKNGIGTAIHYPTAPHQQEAYKGYFKGNYPITEKLAAEMVSLPINPSLSQTEIAYIVDKINAY